MAQKDTLPHPIDKAGRLILLSGVLLLVLAALTVGFGMLQPQAFGLHGAVPGPAQSSTQSYTHTLVVVWDEYFQTYAITNTDTRIFLDVEARVAEPTTMTLAMQTINLGKFPLILGTDVFTTANWSWGEIRFPPGSYQATRLRFVAPASAYLTFSPTTALEDSGLLYDGHYVEDTFFVGEFYGKHMGDESEPDERGFWYYGPLANGEWYDACPLDPECTPLFTPVPEPSPTPRPALTPRPTYTPVPSPTCRPTKVCPVVPPTSTPWPTEPPHPTATYEPAPTPWPTQPF